MDCVLEDWPRTALAKALRGLDDEAPSGAQLFWPVMRCRIAISAAASAGRARSPAPEVRCYGRRFGRRRRRGAPASN